MNPLILAGIGLVVVVIIIVAIVMSQKKSDTTDPDVDTEDDAEDDTEDDAEDDATVTTAEGDICTPETDADENTIYKLNSELECEITSCLDGYELNEDSTMCDIEKTSPIDSLTLITDDFNDSGNLWLEGKNMFKLMPGEYIEATDPTVPEDGNILGMYLTEDIFQVYRRNENSTLFEPIWSQGNTKKDMNLGDWSLKIYRDSGKMRLDGSPSPDRTDGNLFNNSQWEKTQSGTGPFRLDTDNNCPYIILRDKTGAKKQFIASAIRTKYCIET